MLIYELYRTTVYLKLNDTSPIVSLLFWLHDDLIHLRDEKCILVVTISFKNFQRKK